MEHLLTVSRRMIVNSQSFPDGEGAAARVRAEVEHAAWVADLTERDRESLEARLFASVFDLDPADDHTPDLSAPGAWVPRYQYRVEACPFDGNTTVCTACFERSIGW